MHLSLPSASARVRSLEWHAGVPLLIRGQRRLVMVISQLHAVAEAVDDVLWVERTNAGSSTHWLTPADRDDTAQSDLASGLQSLAR
jgi:hypothetical protein